jgi:predicted RNase H-like HicB family nuclease
MRNSRRSARRIEPAGKTHANAVVAVSPIRKRRSLQLAGPRQLLLRGGDPRLDESGRHLYILAANGIGARGVTPYRVVAEWDEDARVWVASSEDVPGLATGADTFEDLVEKLKVVITELLVENGLLPAGTDNVPFAIKAERSELAPVA